MKCYRFNYYSNIGLSAAPLSAYLLSTRSQADNEIIDNVQLERFKDQTVVYKDRLDFERKKAKFIAEGLDPLFI